MSGSRNSCAAQILPARRPPWMLVAAALTFIALPACALPAPPSCTPPARLQAQVKAHPNAQTWTDIGNWFGEHQQFACAQQAFRSALRFQPRSAQLNYLLGLSLYESKNFPDAVAPLQRSIHIDATTLRPHVLLASVFMRLNRPQDAEPEWRAALHIDPTSTLALHGLTESLMDQNNFGGVIALLHGATLDEDSAFSLTIAYTQAGMLLDAIDVAEHAMQSSPGSVRLSNALVALYIKVSRTLDAQHLAEKTWQAHPNDVSVEMAYLRTLVINGDWVPAHPIGAKLLAQAPHDFETLYFNGVMERQAGNYTAARDHLTEALTMNRDQQSVEANLGIALSHLHDYAKAKTHLEKAIELGNSEPDTHFELATVLRALGQTDAARQEMLRYQQAVKDHDNSVLAISKSAEAAQILRKGDLQHAVELYKQAFAAAPKNALIGYRLAMALDQAGDLDAEQTALEQVVAIDPTIALAQNQLGYLESRKGDYAAAETHFRQAVTAAPQFTEAWISLAATLGIETKFPEAQQAVANALRLDPDNQQAKQLSHDLSTAAQKQAPPD